MAEKTTKKNKSQGLPDIGSPEMDQYTEEQLAAVFDHRLWTNPHREQLTDEDVKQGLLLIAQSPEIQKVFIRLRNNYQDFIVKNAKKIRDPEIAGKIEQYAVKHDFVNRLLDRVATLWSQRNKKAK